MAILYLGPDPHLSYSSEHTIYREVLQNANDALATALEIIFEEQEGRSSLLEGASEASSSSPLISQIIIRNNGRPFSQDDWRRLKRIAEGNPDEQKVLFSY